MPEEDSGSSLWPGIFSRLREMNGCWERLRARTVKKVGEIVSGIAPADEIRDAYMQELEAAGYAVRLVPALTQNVMKGARIVSAALRLDEKKHFFTTEAACTLKLTLEPWRNGSAMNRLRFVAVHTESALAGGEPLLESVLKRTLHDVLTRSVPEIVKIVEQK